MENKEWGEYIKKIRQRKKLTQFELAVRTKVSLQSIRQIEQVGHIPKMKALVKIGSVLEISFKKILRMIGTDLKEGEIFESSKK